jgi:hypothetical protein
MITLTGGSFQDSNGTVLAGGTVAMRLSQDAVVASPPYGQVTANETITFSLNSYGNFVSSPLCQIWSNAELSPTSTFYFVDAYDATGIKANRDVILWSFPQGAGSTVDTTGMQNIQVTSNGITILLPGPTGPAGPSGGPTGPTGYTGPGVGAQGPTGYTGYTGATGIATGAPVGALFYIIDGGGVAITTGLRGTINVPTNCTVTGWSLIGDTTGSAVVDVLKSSFTGFPTNSSICGSDKPTLSSAQKNANFAVSMWTTSLSGGNVLQFNVVSAAVVSRLCLSIFVSIP